MTAQEDQLTAKPNRSSQTRKINSQRRWYDVLHSILIWWLRSWRRHVVPHPIRRLLIWGINFGMAFRQHERNKAEPLDDPSENLIIPDQVRLRQGGIWTVEIFPPSRYTALEHSLKQNGWERASFRNLDDSHVSQVRRAREGRGFSWSRIGSVVRTDTDYLIPDAKREDLPKEFEYIELKAVQLGTSVTALVAFFRLSETGESSLDRVWRGAHEPTLSWRWFDPPKVIGRYFAAIEATQHERMRIHNLARTWLSLRCPGFFASRPNVHPILDLNLFDGLDPIAENGSRNVRDAMRALGMNSHGAYQYFSPQMKGSILIPADRNRPHEPLQNCWAIAGEYQKIVDENERSGYGDKPYAPGTLGHIFDDAAEAFILHLAVMSYLSEQQAIYSASRDFASARHRRFTAQRARRLSTELLDSGLDLPAVARDSRDLWGARWRQGINVQAVPIEPYRTDFKPFDLIEALGKRRDFAFERLLEEDESYRTVLSTAAALGASAEAARTGRVALAVAAGSMIVATITLLITQPGDASLWSNIMGWVETVYYNVLLRMQ